MPIADNSFFIASQIQPERLSKNGSGFTFIYRNAHKVISQLIHIITLLIDTYPNIADDTPVREYAHDYHIQLTIEQYETIYKAKHHQEWLIKTVRLDNYCFIEQFISSITHSQDKSHEKRHPLRLEAHKAYTINHHGAFRQIDKISPYANEDIAKKEFMSKPQSTTLINKDIQVPPFGVGERLLAGFLFNPKNTDQQTIIK